ncbi:efflux RND transporter periplasmic adaptor subunit [Azospirillum sp. TSH100]|uniref:efflux RND transporter periplasmic adaptor subunit n=1 Tax=Azospirillum sp. TSH100 TaxID=652764 RepID=UPI0011B22F16|nr:efflux RND transporter periplasmic adaptor subunit [Azospirillum sp. TSH100]
MTMAQNHELIGKLRSLSIDRGDAPKHEPGRAPQRRLWVLAVGLVSAAAAGVAVQAPALFSARSAHAPVAPVASAAPVAASVPLPAPPPSSGLVGSGYVVAPRSVAIKPQAGGRVATLDVELGQRVQAGQILGRLDMAQALLNRRIAQSNVDMAVARVASAEAELSQSLDPLRRLEALAPRGIASEASVADARLKAARLRHEVNVQNRALETSRLYLEQAELDLEHLVIRAPFTGTVVNIATVPGQVVSSGESGGSDPSVLMTLVDTDTLFVDVDIAETNIAGIAPGQPARVVLDAYPKQERAASVLLIEPSASRQKGTVTVRLSLPNTGGGMLANMAAKVVFDRMSGSDRPGSEKKEKGEGQ